MSEDTSNQTELILFTVLRVSMGWIFLFAFLDKAFGIFEFEYNGAKYGTNSDSAWINGGEPTWGFLTFGTQGKLFEDFFSGLADNALVEILFMFGLLGIGVAMILGIGRKIAGISGALMMIFMWLASLPINNNPILDDHVVYAMVFLILGFTKNHGYIFVPQWKSIAEQYPILE